MVEGTEQVDLGPMGSYDKKKRVCRAEAHDWPYGTRLDHYDDEVGENGAWIGWRRVLPCRRCRSKKVTLMDAQGYTRSYIDYAAGYRIPDSDPGEMRRLARLARVYEQGERR